MTMTRWFLGTVLILVTSVASLRLAAAQNPSDVAQGKKLFEGLCVTCHGFEGAGGDAPNLNRPKLTRAPDDATLLTIIRDGIPNGGMPRVRRLSENELRQLVSYVRSLGRTTSVAATGNPASGAAIYKKLACNS